MNLKGKNFLKLLDFTPEEIGGLLDLAAELKAKKKAGIPHPLCQGKNIVLLFEKDSTRTRCAFEVAGYDLGMGVTYLGPTGSQMGKKESIADTARVLGRMYDGIEYRGFGQKIVEELGAKAGVPVWNGLTNEFHPTQVLADFLTIQEHFGKLQGVKLVFLGDARYNMGDSLMVGCAKMGMHFVACAPKKYFPDPELVAQCQAVAQETGAVLEFCEDPETAVQGADVLYTDVWVSMGEPMETWAERIADLAPYQVNAALMAKAGPQAVFMHCLPSFHDLNTTIGKEMGEAFGRKDMEVTDEVFESRSPSSSTRRRTACTPSKLSWPPPWRTENEKKGAPVGCSFFGGFGVRASGGRSRGRGACRPRRRRRHPRGPPRSGGGRGG